MSVVFGDDGSMTLTDEDGNKYIQKNDGTWAYEDADGNQLEFGNDWTDNEFTKVVPKPNMTISSSFGEGSEYSVLFTSDTTLDAVKAYAEQLKNKGFTIDAETYDQTNYGVTTYTYSASNSVGYKVELVYNATAGIVSSALSISKNVD